VKVFPYQSQSIKSVTAFSNAKALMSGYEDHSKLKVTEPKDLEIYKLPDKKLSIIILKSVSKLQNNTSNQFNEIRKIIQKQN
jgi:hypothetical protein